MEIFFYGTEEDCSFNYFYRSWNLSINKIFRGGGLPSKSTKSNAYFDWKKWSPDLMVENQQRRLLALFMADWCLTQKLMKPCD